MQLAYELYELEVSVGDFGLVVDWKNCRSFNLMLLSRRLALLYFCFVPKSDTENPLSKTFWQIQVNNRLPTICPRSSLKYDGASLTTWGMNLLAMVHWMMKSMNLTVGDALYLYTICSILPDSSDLLPYKESLFLWLCIEPPRHAWHRPAVQQPRVENQQYCQHAYSI